MKVRAVVFDMDGTLFNTENIYDEVSDIVLGRRQHPFTRELKLKMMGLPSRQAFQVMIDHCQLNDSIEALSRETHDLFQEMLPTRIRMMPGLESLLNFLEQRNLPLAVATSSTRALANMSLESCSILERFQFVLTSEDVKQGKPDPEIYQLAANRLQVLPEEMVVFEDSPIGSQSAVASGAITIAVPNDHTRHFNFDHTFFRVESLEDRWIHDTLFS